MTSSLAAILASPVSGVSGAVTGYPIGRGNGVSTVFVAPPEITAISALYRRDWQGNMALSASARTNYSDFSEPAISQLSAKSATVTDSSAPVPFAGNAIHFPAALQTDYAYVSCPTGIVNPIVSVFIKMDDGGVPVPGTTFNLYINAGSTWVSSNLTVLALSNGLCRVSGKWVGTMTGGSFGLKRNATTDRGFQVVGFMIEPGGSATTPTGYIKCSGAATSLTDYTASGTTLTLAEAPALAAELTVDGTSVNLPLLQIGGY